MSARLNLTLLRTLKTPMINVLVEVQDQLKGLLLGHTIPSPWKGKDEIKTLEDGVSLAGSRGLSKIIHTLLDAMDAIEAEVAKKSDVMFLQSVIRSAIQLTDAMVEHLEALARGEIIETVLLWPYLDALSRALNRPSPPPEALFEPGSPVLPEKVGLKRASKADVKKASHQARSNLQKSIGVLSQSNEKPAIEGELKEIQKILDLLSELRPQSEFQAYWVALRGSAAIAQMDIPTFLAHREEWINRFKQGVNIIESFGADGRHVDEEKLYNAIWPLLGSHPRTWSMLNPVISETETLFGLEEFKAAALEAKNTEFQRGLENFRAQRSTLKDILLNMQQVWNTVIAKKTNKQSFAHASSPLLANRVIFPGDTISPLFDSLQVVIDRFNAKPQEPIDDQLSEELATTILVLLDAIESGGRWGEEVGIQVRLQKQRLDLAVARRFTELTALPKTKLTSLVNQERGRVAEGIVIDQVRKNLQAIRHTLEGVWEQDKESIEKIPSMTAQINEVEGVLQILHQTAASKAASHLRPHLNAMEHEAQREDESHRQAIRDHLGALMAFLSSWEVGDKEAALRLNSVLSMDEISTKDAIIKAPIQDHIEEPVKVPNLDSSVQSNDVVQDNKDNITQKSGNQKPSIEPSIEEKTVETKPETKEIEHLSTTPLSQELPQESLVSPVLKEPLELQTSEELEHSSESLLSSASHDLWDKANNDEIAEAFLEEAAEIFDRVDSDVLLLNSLQDMHEPRAEEALREIRRAFHTIKGSGMLCGYERFGLAAKEQEEALNLRLLAPGIWDEEQTHWIQQVVLQMRQWWQVLKTEGTAEIDLTKLPSIPSWSNTPIKQEEWDLHSEPESTESTESTTGIEPSAPEFSQSEPSQPESDQADEGVEEAHEAVSTPISVTSGVESKNDELDSLFAEDFENSEKPLVNPDLSSSESELTTSPSLIPEELAQPISPLGSSEEQELDGDVLEEIVSYIDTLKNFGQGMTLDFNAYRAIHNAVALGREHFALYSWLKLAEAMHEVWNQTQNSKVAPSCMAESCLILAIDMQREIQQGHTIQVRKAWIERLSQPVTSSSSISSSGVDWDNAFKALEGMGDHFQKLVEALSSKASE